MAQLPHDGREYFHWPVDGLPADGVALEVFLAGAWHPLTIASDRKSVSILLQGPDVDVSDPSAVTIPTDQSRIRIRAVDNPEVIVRGGGDLRLTK